jgi:hypothetical protein
MTYRSRIAAILAVTLLIIVFLAGYWPERQKRIAAQRETGALRARVTLLDDHARAAQLHAALLDLIDETAAMNYGRAQTLSSVLFDQVRAEASRTTDAKLRTVFEEILARRDVVTAALAKGEAAVLQPLQESERSLRHVAGGVPPRG